MIMDCAGRFEDGVNFSTFQFFQPPDEFKGI